MSVAGADNAIRDRVVPGRRPVLELLRAGTPVEKVLVAQEAVPAAIVTEIRRLARAAAVPVRSVPRAEIDALAAGSNHQGVVAIASRYRYASLSDLVAAPDPLVVFLDGVTDPHNLGSLLRSADCAGFTGVVVPARRSVGVTPAVRRVAAGAAEVVPVARVGNLSGALDDAKRSGLWAVGLDERGEDDIWSSELLEAPLALVLGAEDRGISRTVRARCDALAQIPLSGKLASLNVAVAGAIAMFEVARRRAPG